MSADVRSVMAGRALPHGQEAVHNIWIDLRGNVMKTYENFARVYDELMDNVPYEECGAGGNAVVIGGPRRAI